MINMIVADQEDIVDFLVGWKLEPTLPSSTAKVISTTFKKFKSYWISNKAFTMDLLGKLVTDIFNHSNAAVAEAQKPVQAQKKPQPHEDPDFTSKAKFPIQILHFLEYAG